MLMLADSLFIALMSGNVTTPSSSSRDLEFPFYFAKEIMGLEGACDPKAS